MLFDVLSIGTATSDVDFNVVNSEVFFEEGQKRKSLPLRILDDRLAERQEWFVVRLTQPTGGAKLSAPTECNVTIDASDDPNGLFGEFHGRQTDITGRLTDKWRDGETKCNVTIDAFDDPNGLFGE